MHAVLQSTRLLRASTPSPRSSPRDWICPRICPSSPSRSHGPDACFSGGSSPWWSRFWSSRWRTWRRTWRRWTSWGWRWRWPSRPPLISHRISCHYYCNSFLSVAAPVLQQSRSVPHPSALHAWVWREEGSRISTSARTTFFTG